MKINTTRFSRVEIEQDDVLFFPQGLMGLEDCQHWVLLADAENELLGWLQSTTRPEIAMAVVSPRRLVAGYQVRIARNELAPLSLTHPQQAKVLVIVGRNDRSITLNLKAPLLIHLDQRLGRQVLNNADQPLQYELQPLHSMKKIA